MSLKLSFVIPAFNEAAYIGDCLESIFKQKENYNIEIIVVDNACTDNTIKVALLYKDVIIVTEPRKGLTFARQAGFKAATGDIIANVDADSRLTPGWIKKVFEEFNNNQDLVVLSGPFSYYELTKTKYITVKFFYMLAYLLYLFNTYILKVGGMVQGGNFIVRKTALESIGGFDTSIKFYGEDTDIARRMHNIGKVNFTFSLKMFSSARRLNKEGMFLTAWRYSVNYFWIIFFKRPFSQNYNDIRKETTK